MLVCITLTVWLWAWQKGGEWEASKVPGGGARGKQPRPPAPGLLCWPGKLGVCRSWVKVWCDYSCGLRPEDSQGHSWEEGWGEDEAGLGPGNKG